MSLPVGSHAPDFTVKDTNGNNVSLSDFTGKTVVLYFYPKDDTPGCTKQACSLRDHYGEIRDTGTAILGVSTQDVSSHQQFTAKYQLNFPLVADTDGSIGRAYGAMGGGFVGAAMNLMGMANRITFIIDENGHIAHIIDQPDCAHHAKEVLKLL